MSWPYEYDRTADCGCCWYARFHGDVCPEHGSVGRVPTERDAQLLHRDRLRATSPTGTAVVPDAQPGAEMPGDSMTPLTDGQLDELARLEAEATQGEWFAFFRKGGLGGTEAEICADDPGRGTFRLATFDCGNLDQSDRDRNFIIAARNALPALLAELRLLRARKDGAK